MNHRSLRLLGASTALALAGSLLVTGAAGATPGADDPAPSEASSVESRSVAPATGVGPGAGRRVAPAGAGVTVGTTAVSSDVFAPVVQPSARPARWPIGGAVADLTAHPEAASGDTSQQITRARMIQYRARGGVMAAVVRMAAAPSPATNAILRLAFGRVDSAGTECLSPAGANVAVYSTKTTQDANPVYRGRTIEVTPFRMRALASYSPNCAFVQSRTVDDASKYDAVAGGAQLFRQTPALTVKVTGRKLKRQGWTRIPIRITNSRGTVATARNVRLSWKARGVAVRANKRVGTIKPGRGKRGSFLVRDTRRGNGSIVFTVRSGNYKVKVKVKITERRR